MVVECDDDVTCASLSWGCGSGGGGGVVLFMKCVEFCVRRVWW